MYSEWIKGNKKRSLNVKSSAFERYIQNSEKWIEMMIESLRPWHILLWGTGYQNPAEQSEPSSWEITMKSPRVPLVFLLNFPSLGFFSRRWCPRQESPIWENLWASTDRHRKHKWANKRQVKLRLLSLHFQFSCKHGLDPSPLSQNHWDRSNPNQRKYPAQYPCVLTASF